jgi:rhodanese-related sulfurtransferase
MLGMADLYHFVAENALLCIAFLLAFILFLKSDHPFFSGVSLIEPGEVVALVNDGAVILDMRDEKAFQAGHITQAKLFSTVEPSQFKKDEKIILYVQKGQAAQQKAITLRRTHKAVHFFVLQGGLDAWIDSGFPTVK